MHQLKILTATAGLCLLTSEAHAFDLLTEGGACPNGFEFTADQQIAINTTFTGADSFPLADAMVDVTRRINNVGGQWFDYLEPYLVTGGGYTRQTSDNINPNGFYEVGMTNMAGTGASGSGGALVNLANCTIIEADVFLDTNTNWVFGVPELYGDNYYAAGANVNVNGVSERYGRTVLLHELLHTLSLAHSNTTYSFMNQTNRPWSNRSEEKQVEPLPDDREGLRFLYGDNTTETDVAALVTWFAPNAAAPATGTRLCNPSGGTGFSANLFAPTCGVVGAADGSTTLCPGDTLYVRFALANYGTSSISVDPELWFSTNDWLDTSAGVDVESPTVKAAVVLGVDEAALRGYTFEIPSTLAYDTDYFPIVHLNSGALLATEESQQNNWIPLIDTIHIDTQANCP